MQVCLIKHLSGGSAIRRSFGFLIEKRKPPDQLAEVNLQIALELNGCNDIMKLINVSRRDTE